MHKTVKTKLKAPSTAKFSSINQSDVYKTKETSMSGDRVKIHFSVSGSVDAQNSFGALIRSSFRCTVIGETGGKWSVTNVTVS